MPIDSTTTIYQLDLSIPVGNGVPHRGVEARVVVGRNRVKQVPQTAYGVYDPSDPEVVEVLRRVKNGLKVVYFVRDAVLTGPQRREGVPDSELPEAYEYLRTTHPFHADFEAPSKAIGPYQSIHFMRSASPLVNPPNTVRWTHLESPAAFEQRLVQASWPADPPTGTDDLYWTIVVYGRSANGSVFTYYSLPRNGDVEWSINGGFTWLADYPADYDTVTHLRYRSGTEWIVIQPRRKAPPAGPWLVVSPRIAVTPIPTDGQTALSIEGASLAEMYALGLRMDVTDGSGVIQRSGEAWTTTSRVTGDDRPYGIQLSPSAVLDETTPAVPYRYLIAQHDLTGEVKLLHCGIAPNDAALTGYSAAYLTFASYPLTTLIADAAADSATIAVFSADGMREGDILYIADEQLRINADITSLSLSVDRGVNGTTAGAYVVGDVVRGTVNDDQLRYVHVWDRGSTLPSNTWMAVVCERVVRV